MAHIVTDRCEGNRFTDCVVVCPVDAFHLLPNMLVINPDSCVDCGACVTECPVKAIFPDHQLPEQYAKFVEFNQVQSMNSPICNSKLAPLKKD